MEIEYADQWISIENMRKVGLRLFLLGGQKGVAKLEIGPKMLTSSRRLLQNIEQERN